MAGKNQVTLTFAGEDRELRQTVDRVAQGNQALEQSFDRVGQGASRLRDSLGEGARGADDAVRGLDRLEESGGNAETRFLGLGAGISGATTLMQGGKLSAEDMAMSLADLGDFTEHTLAPAMKSVKDGIGNLVSGFRAGEGSSSAFRRNLGTIAVGAAGATAAIGLITMTIMEHQQQQERARERAQEWTQQLQELGGDVDALRTSLITTDDRFQGLRNIMADTGITTAQVDAALRGGAGAMTELFQAAGVTDGRIIDVMQAEGQLRTGIDAATEAFEANTAATRDNAAALQEHQDALRAQFDPLFAMRDATAEVVSTRDELRAAQDALNLTLLAYGDGSLEALEAQQRLSEAQTAAQDAVVALQGAAIDLQLAVEQGRLSATSATKQFVDMAVGMGFTQAEALRLAGDVGFLVNEGKRLTSQPFAVNVFSKGVKSTIDQLRWVKATAEDVAGTYFVDVVSRIVGGTGAFSGIGKRAHGGPVDAGRLYEVTEQGRAELLQMGNHTYLIPGSSGSVIPADAMAGGMPPMAPGHGSGGTTVNVYVQGSIRSDRDLLELVANEMRYGSLRGLAR